MTSIYEKHLKKRRKQKRVYFKLLIRYIERMEHLPQEQKVEYIEFLSDQIELVNRKSAREKEKYATEQRAEDPYKEYVYSLLTDKYLTTEQIYEKSDKRITLQQLRYRLYLLNEEGRVYRIRKWLKVDKPDNRACVYKKRLRV